MTKRPDILYLTHRVPYPPNRGDRIRSFHTLRFLARRANVYLACLTEEPLAEGTLARLHELCAGVEVVPVGHERWLRGAWSLARGRSITEGLFRSPRLRKIVARWNAEVDFQSILVLCSSMFQFAPRRESAGVRTVVDLIDVDSQKWQDYARDARGLKRLLFKLEGRRVRQLESRVAREADAVTLVSEQEAELFRQTVGAGAIHAVTNGVDTDHFQPAAAEHETNPCECVFVGVLDYRANVEGLRWFCREVWPEVRRRVPEATFRIVGRRPTEAVLRLAEIAGVEVIGEVSDVRGQIARAAVVVAPLQVARGIQNKVLEALAMAKPVVATPQALEGIDLQPGQHAIEATTVSSWGAAFETLFADAAEAQRIGLAGRRFVQRRHSWSACLNPLSSLLGLNDAADEDSAKLPSSSPALEDAAVR